MASGPHTLRRPLDAVFQDDVLDREIVADEVGRTQDRGAEAHLLEQPSRQWRVWRLGNGIQSGVRLEAILVKDDPERVRDWARCGVELAAKAPASWDQYVTLIESADAILHKMVISANFSWMAQSAKSQNYSRLH